MRKDIADGQLVPFILIPCIISYIDEFQVILRRCLK